MRAFWSRCSAGATAIIAGRPISRRVCRRRPGGHARPPCRRRFTCSGGSALAALLRRRAVVSVFHLGEDADEVLKLMQKYADVPMSFADASLVRMTEVLADPILLTTDTDIRVYRRHSRQAVPCVIPR